MKQHFQQRQARRNRQPREVDWQGEEERRQSSYYKQRRAQLEREIEEYLRA